MSLILVIDNVTNVFCILRGTTPVPIGFVCLACVSRCLNAGVEISFVHSHIMHALQATSCV